MLYGNDALELKVTKSLKIYIAGPYSAETEEQRSKNVNAAIDAGIRILSKGHFPFIPHLTHFVDMRAEEINHPIEWEDYINWDMVWLEMCDALLCLGSSRGAEIEVQAAKNLGKQIFYSVDEIPVVIREGDKVKFKLERNF